jgi:general secretion pathway protein I
MSRRRREAGFTLIETVVALTILSLGLVALVPVFGEVLDRDFRSDSQAVAASLAQSLTARLGVDLPLTAETKSGSFGNGYRWEVAVQPYGDAEDRAAWVLAPYQVQVTIRWSVGTDERSITLTTLRLGPKDAAP